MPGRVRLGGPVLAGFIASMAACTKESVRPSAAEAATPAVESEAAPSASAATLDADVPDAAPARGAAGVDAAPAFKEKDAAPVATTTTSMTTTGTADAGAKTLTLDESSDGKIVEVARGGTLVVQLAATPSSGFDWAVTKAPPALGAPTLGFVAGGESMGASGKRRIVWTLKEALPAGEHPVELGYARSFEKGVAPFKTFRFKVRAAR